MSESGGRSSSSSSFVVALLYIHLAVSFDDDFYFVFYICFYLALFFFSIFLRYVFLFRGFGVGDSCSFVGGFYFSFHAVAVVAFDMITDTFLAQSFLTFILRVGVCVIVSLIFTRVLAHGFGRAR